MAHVAVACALGGTATLLACLFLISTKQKHGRFTLDTTQGIQKFHDAPTPRVGGLAVAVGLTLALLLMPSPQLAALLLLSSLPAFGAGLLEDLTKGVSIAFRLAATVLSSLLMSALSEVMLTRVDVIGVDTLLRFWPLAALFTAFAVSGAANAFNIIDGFNGLAAGVALISLSALAVVCQIVGDVELLQLCLVLMAVTLGFLILNFPKGLIFLGDGGAYLLGFLVAWVAILLPMRNPSVSVWTGLLVCGYPILETLFSIVRKLVRQGHHPGQPDRVHLHMLVFRRMSTRVFASRPRRLQNGLTSLFAWTYAALPAIMAVCWFNQTPKLAAGLCLAACIYWAVYMRLTQFRWCFSPVLGRVQRAASQA